MSKCECAQLVQPPCMYCHARKLLQPETDALRAELEILREQNGAAQRIRFAQENQVLRAERDSWRKQAEIESEDVAWLLSRHTLAVEALERMKKDCEWYAQNGTEQERHHFVAVELVHEMGAALAKLKVPAGGSGTAGDAL